MRRSDSGSRLTNPCLVAWLAVAAGLAGPASGLPALPPAGLLAQGFPAQDVSAQETESEDTGGEDTESDPADSAGGSEASEESEEALPPEAGAPAVAATAAPGAEEGGAILLESVSSRGKLAPSLIETLELAPATASNPAGLVVGENRIPLEDMLFLRFPWRRSALQPVTFFLRRGGELQGRVAGGDEDHVRIACPTLRREPGDGEPGEESTFEVSLESLQGLLVSQPPAGPRGSGSDTADRSRLRKTILSERPERDQLILLQEGRVEGILESLGSAAIVFSSEDLGTVEIAYGKLRALLLADLGEEPAAGLPAGSQAPRVRLTLRDGTALVAGIEGLKASVLRLRHPDLGGFSVPLAETSEIAFLGGRSSYLSDLEPVRVKEQLGPAFVLTRPYRRDTNVLGEPLRMAGREYRKGLGVHSYSLLEFSLEGKYSRFLAWIGLDETARPENPAAAQADVGSVVFRLALDGKALFEKAMTWRDEPFQIDVPIAQGKLLALEVDYGGSGSSNFALDRANWADALVIK